MTEIDREGVERLARNLWATHQESAALMSHEKVYRMAFRHGFEAAEAREKAAEDEVKRLQRAIRRYGDRTRMAWAPPELQPSIDKALTEKGQDDA